MNKKVIIGIVGGVIAAGVVGASAIGIIKKKKKNNGYIDATKFSSIDDLPEEIDDSFFDEE